MSKRRTPEQWILINKAAAVSSIETLDEDLEHLNKCLPQNQPLTRKSFKAKVERGAPLFKKYGRNSDFAKEWFNGKGHTQYPWYNKW